MTKLIIIGLLVLAAIVLAIWAIILKWKEDMLDKRDVALNEKDFQIKAAMDSLIAEQKALELRDVAPLFDGTPIRLSASYAVSDSDYMKYKGETAIKNVARNRIAHNIAFDIIKKFPNPKYENGVYSYNFKVVEE